MLDAAALVPYLPEASDTATFPRPQARTPSVDMLDKIGPLDLRDPRDPRDASLETEFTSPKTWYRDSSDGLSSSTTFFSGLILVTRNRYLAWPSMLYGLTSMFNAHPLRAKEAGLGWSNLALCITALIVSYIPAFVVDFKS